MEKSNNYNHKYSTDKEVFSLLNDIDLSEDIPGTNDIEVSNKEIRKIKNLVIRNISGIKKEKYTAKRRYYVAAAAIALLLIMPTFLLNSTVRAAVEGALQFIPGIGIAKNTTQDSRNFIITEKISKPYDNGNLAIKGLAVSSEGASIVIEGSNINDLKSVTLQEDNGEKYKMKVYATGRYGGSFWSVAYKYTGKVKLGSKYNVVIDNKLKIPVSLVESKEVKSFEDLGPTATKDNISITAIPYVEDDKMRVTLLSPDDSDKKIISFGECVLPVDFNFTSKAQEDHYKNASPAFIVDAKGNKYMAFETNNILMLGKEFYFKTAINFSSNYTLEIPKVAIEYNTSTEFTAELPELGNKSNKQTVNLKGFSLATYIERISQNKIKVFIENEYNKNLPENLLSFDINAPELNIKGRSSHSEMKSNNMFASPESFELQFDNLDMNQKQIKLMFSNPIIEKKGPWNIKISQ